MFKMTKKTSGKVTCSTYIDSLTATIVYVLNLLKIGDEKIDSEIESFKKLAKSIKYEENTDKLNKLRDLITEFVVGYDSYITNKKKEVDRLVLGNINILINLAKGAEGSKKWIKTLDNVKEILKERLDKDSLGKTKELLFNLGYSSKDTKDTVYRDIIGILFSLLDIETDSPDAGEYIDKVKSVREKLSSNPYFLDSKDIRNDIKELIEKKEKLEEAYISSLHGKLNKALKALIYTITTFSASSSNYVDTFQDHIDEINSALQSDKIDVDELSKRLIGIAIKIKDTTVNMRSEIDSYSKKMKEAKETIDELKQKLEDARENMVTDPLTGVYNRRGLFHFMSQEIERARRYNHPVSVIMADLDHFSNVNNTYGHLAGDIVLKKFCQTAQTIIRSADILTRYGGEEFIIILPNSDIESAYTVAEKIRAAISKLKFQYKDSVFSITSSFGVAQFKQKDTVESLIKRVDTALYKAKEKRNCTVRGE